MKKIIALVLALCMILMVNASFAATNERTLDGSISISGLEDGDTVDFYRVLKFDQNATTTGGWVADTGFGGDSGLNITTIQRILGLDSNGKPVVLTDENRANYGINAALAGTIGDLAESATAKYTGSAVTYSDAGTPVVRTATVSGVEAGLYIAIVHPGQAGTMYNPVFVGADYSTTDGTNAWTVNMADSYNPASKAKKTHTDLNKTAQDERSIDDNFSETVSVGDDVTFTVTTKIPEFASNYTSPVFKVTDALSDGLTLDTTSIHVYAATVSDAGVYTKGAEITTGFSIPEATLSTSGYQIVFAADYLKGLQDPQPIWIEYVAEVNSAAVTNVTAEDNTVTINFSNNPTDTEGHGVLKDETKHYTFSIDANLLGPTTEGGPWKTVEVVKVGIDENGNEITAENVTWHEGVTTTTIGALEGAEFVLLKADKSAYTNKYITANTKIVSDSTGRLTIEGTTDGIKGLDAGIYYLRETQAPAGYIKAQDDVKIEISCTYKTTTKTENGVTWSFQELDTYTILINEEATASYTMINDEEARQETEIPGNHGYINDENTDTQKDDGKIKNVKGVELPSTGGIGTTIFYILGGLLVVGAVVILVARRKAQD